MKAACQKSGSFMHLQKKCQKNATIGFAPKPSIIVLVTNYVLFTGNIIFYETSIQVCMIYKYPSM